MLASEFTKKASNFFGITKHSPWIRNDLVLELLFISLLITPFQNLIDVAWMFTVEDFNEWYTINTPLLIKITKDLVLIFMLLFLFFQKIKLSKLTKVVLYSLCGILSYSIVISILHKTPLLVIVSGVRWYLPLLLIPLFDDYQITQENYLSFLKRYRLIIFLSVCLQIFQIFFSGRWGDGTIHNFRAGGFFAMPQPMGLFALFFLALSIEFSIDSKKNFGLSALSIFLTKSAAGFLGLGAIIFYKVPKKIKVWVFFLVILLLGMFPYITGRADYWTSPMIRLKTFLEINTNEIIFGSYTNTCKNFQAKNLFANICKTPDAFLIGLLGNLGLIFTLIILGIFSYYIIKSKRYFLFMILIIILMAGSYTEYFPMNLLLPFMIGFRIKSDLVLSGSQA